MNNQMKLEFLSLAENVALARVTIASFASQLDFTLTDLEEIKVAVSEGVSNSIIHGYGNQPDGTVRVIASISGDTLELRIEDDGKGIEDIPQALQPAFSTEPDRMGLGFVFMQSFMDQFQVTSEPGRGTRVFMVKKQIVHEGGVDKVQGLEG
ncbi:MAG: anti-sigma F factor [Clostridia bacterium]|nr:anti-sigma F factor [Clostridia bacterium]